LLVSKGIITEEELKASEKARGNTPSQSVQGTPEAVQPPAPDQV
jgi:hypothetical protein